METTTQPETFPISPYDNQISLLYKASQYFETPTRYVTVRDRSPDDVTTETVLVIDDLTYEPFIDVLARTLDNPDITLAEAFTSLVDEGSTITRQEFALLYFSYSSARDIPEEEAFNLIQEFLGNEAFRGITDLRVRHEAWIERWNQELEEDADTLNRILDIQDGLENIPEEFIKPTSNLVVDRVTLRAFPLLATGERPTREDGIDIFNAMRLSYLVPYAHYNEGSALDPAIIRQAYFKIYRGETTTTDIGSPGSEPNLSMIIPTTKTKATNKGNLIYATVWTGDPDQVITRPTREGYTKAIYDLDTGTMTFKTRISEKNPRAKELLIERINEAFPNLILGDITETRISGEFDIFLGDELQDYVLLHEILNNPTFTSYLYVDERQKAYPEKKRVTIHYRSIIGEAAEETARGGTTQAPASVSAVLGQRYITDDQATPELPAGTPYLRVNITRGASRDVAEQFREILTLLMGIYLQDRDDIIATYADYIPPLVAPAEGEVVEPKNVKPGRRKIVIKTGKAKRVIYQLQDAAPHIFLPGYARRCQGHLQPLVITQNEIPAWREKRIRNKNTGQLDERQVMPFPPLPLPDEEEVRDLIARKVRAAPTARLYLDDLEKLGPQATIREMANRLPPDPEIQAILRRLENPNLIEGPLPEDRILIVCPDDSAPYPGVKENQLPNANVYPYIPCCNETDQTIQGKKTNYNAYYRGAVVEAKGEKRRMNIITAKILFPGGMGEIPVPLERVLIRYSQEASNFKRFGVIRDPNSFIHCILEALDYQDYTRLQDEEKVALALDVRRSLPTEIQLAVMKQELYDFSLEEIENQVLTEELFFDPALYYRALEEYFNINIYTFTPGKRPKEATGEAVGKIEIPRHKLFHARPIRLGRPTILIFKHWGAEADALVYPQCELLIDYDKETRTQIKSFGDEMTEITHNVLLETFPITTWSYQTTPETTGNLVTHTNLYSRVNFDVLTGQQATAQILDDYGKMRGLVIPRNGQDVTVFFIPSQPENLPIAPQATITTGNEAEDFFGNPVAVTLSEDNKQAVGLWFSHQDIPDYPYAIFVPIAPVANYLTLDQGPAPPLELATIEDQTAARILLLQRQISFLLQIIRWLFILYAQTETTDDIVDTFLTRYTLTNQEPVQDSAQFYDLSRIPHRLPNAESVDAAIAVLEPLAPTLFQQGKFVLYSPTFAEKIRDHLDAFLRQTRGLDLKTPRFLENYFIYESDFEQQPRTIILVGQENLNIWLSSLQRAGYRGVNILAALDTSLINRIEPYLYLSETGTIYLVQNVEDGDISRALQVTVSWFSDLINPGFTSVQHPDIETLPYRIYEISPSSALRVKEEFADPDTPPDQLLEVLEYAENNYAALLPLSQEAVTGELA